MNKIPALNKWFLFSNFQGVVLPPKRASLLSLDRAFYSDQDLFKYILN